MTPNKALVIDDNRKNGLILKQLLNKEGMDSIVLTNPTQVDTVFDKAAEFRVAFLDLEMPMIDGFQLLDKLRSNPDFDDVPIVAYTVHVSEIKVAHDHGFDGFIGKPLDLDRFPQQLERILNGEPVWETR